MKKEMSLVATEDYMINEDGLTEIPYWSENVQMKDISLGSLTRKKRIYVVFNGERRVHRPLYGNPFIVTEQMV